MKEITFEEAQKAAAKVREYMDKGESCLGAKWVDETFDLAYTLQNWRYPSILDHSQDRNDFEEEFAFIHYASTHNWHRYEDVDY